MIYKFEHDPKEVTVLDFPKGYRHFPNSALVHYIFGTEPKGDVQIRIDDYYFGKKDIDQLCEFLQALKQKL